MTVRRQHITVLTLRRRAWRGWSSAFMSLDRRKGPPVPDNERRKFQLSINPDTRLGDVPSFKVDISEAGVAALRVNERAAPGPILVVTRGQPVAVEILNHLNEPTAIHWHGIELESYDDGVADFGGSSRQHNTAGGPSWDVHGEIHSTARRYLHLPHTLA